MDNALDVEGLPEVIHTSEGNVFLHLPGVIVAESSTGETRYLLGDGPFDRLRTGWAVSARRWMKPGRWWQAEVGLLHLRARWYLAEAGTFLSRDVWEGDDLRPQSLNGWNYVEGNPINAVDPSGLYAWSIPTNHGLGWQHGRIQRWFEGKYGFWQSNFEFAKYSKIIGEPDIIYFPELAPPYCRSPIDFSAVPGAVGELYEIKPLRILPPSNLQHTEKAYEQLFSYYVGLNTVAYFGGLQGKLPAYDRAGKSTGQFAGQDWNWNTVRWQLGTRIGQGPWSLPLRGQPPLLLFRPAPGLLLYVDNITRQQAEALGLGVLTALTVQQMVDKLLNGSKLILKPAANAAPNVSVPIFNPTSLYELKKCVEHPEFCQELRP